MTQVRIGLAAVRIPAAFAGVVVSLGLSAAACGGSTPTPKVSTAKSAAPVSTSPAPAPASTKGQQVAALAAPSANSELSGDAKTAYDKGFQAWTAGDLQAAKAAFMDAASRAPRAGSPRYSLGCVLERLGDNQGALDAYRASYSASSKYEVSMGAYALLLARTGRGSEAEQFLGSKQSQTPDSARILSYLAEVKSIEGDSPGAQQLAQQALAKQPDFKDAMVVIARDYYRSHKWDLAKYALQAILDGDDAIPPRDKGNPDGLLVRALIERESGDRKQALVDFEQASARRPDMFEAYINLGEMKLEAGNATEAQRPLEKAVRYAPNVPIAHLDLGDCYRLLGRPADAKKEFDTALGMDSTLAGAHYDLGLLYLFSPNVPGVSGQDAQLAKAIQELETYRSMRSARAAKGPGDDVDELLSTAKRKQSELQLKKQAAAAPPPPPATSAATPPPASSNAPKPGPSPAASSAPPASSGNIVRDLPK
ncbi:MAG TPA: tetratricopeptide repeat protein [Polyangiaceae bacterium]|jgi:tetratricopeptide (TPR) repeat protein